MKKNRLMTSIAIVALAVCSCLFMFGCGPQGSKEAPLASTIEDTLLVTPGTLTVGINSANAPFGGESNGSIVGIDVDTAAALATELGLKLAVIDTNGQDVAQMLNDRRVDLVTSLTGTTQTEAGIAFVGPYLENGPALFGKSNGDNATVDLNTLNGTKIGAYAGSIAANAASAYCGAENIVSFMSLSEAFDALQAGEVAYVASDLVAGGYLALSYDGIDYLVSLQNPSGLYMGAAFTNSGLVSAVDAALKTLESNGVLQTVSAKWTGKKCSEHTMPTAAAAPAPEAPAPEPAPAAEPAAAAEPAPVEQAPVEEAPAE